MQTFELIDFILSKISCIDLDMLATANTNGEDNFLNLFNKPTIEIDGNNGNHIPLVTDSTPSSPLMQTTSDIESPIPSPIQFEDSAPCIKEEIDVPTESAIEFVNVNSFGIDEK